MTYNINKIESNKLKHMKKYMYLPLHSNMLQFCFWNILSNEINVHYYINKHYI